MLFYIFGWTLLSSLISTSLDFMLVVENTASFRILPEGSKILQYLLVSLVDYIVVHAQSKSKTHSRIYSNHLLLNTRIVRYSISLKKSLDKKSPSLKLHLVRNVSYKFCSCNFCGDAKFKYSDVQTAPFVLLKTTLKEIIRY